jgi:hypothetical protein
LLTALEVCMRTAGTLQLLQLPLMVLAQRHLGWRDDLQRLAIVNRRLVLAMAAGIVLYVTGTGVIALLHPRDMLMTAPGVAICLLQAVAWTIRTAQQLVGILPAWPVRAAWLGRVVTLLYATLSLIYAGSFVSMLVLAPTPD